jgi:hypothetical protein
MDCSKIEQWLSEYLESSLPAEDMDLVASHLKACSSCSALADEMRSVLSLCHQYPALEMDPDFVEKILLRTSGRPRTRSFRERLQQYFVRPLLTPRFAVGASIATLFLALTVNLMVPRISGAVSALSPQELLRLLDRGVNQLYGEGLKAYEAKNEWQAQFSRFKNNTWNSLRSIMEQMDGPVQGRKKSNESEPPKENAPKEKSSGVLAERIPPA